MSTIPLPQQPNLEQLRNQARELQRAVRSGQPRAVEAVGLLVAAGFDVNAYGRGDVPIEQEWQTALHTAVERGNTRLAQRLLDLGADKNLRDRRFDGTPSDWAEHLGRPELAELLNG